MVLHSHSSVVESVLAALEGETPQSLLPFFRYCLEHAAKPLTVETVARAHGLHRRAMEYRLKDAGLASPGICIAWCRLLLAVDRLEHTSMSQEQVALELGYGTAGALRKAVARHLKVPGRTLRDSGAFDHAMVRFVQTLRSDLPQLKRRSRDQGARRPP